MRIRAAQLVIFDCDGVVVDSESVSARVTQRLLATMGREMSLEEIDDRFTGLGGDAFRALLSTVAAGRVPDDWADQYARWYASEIRDGLRPIPGIRDAIAALPLPFGMASNSSHPRIRESLHLIGLLSAFDGRISSADDVATGKPAPDVYLHAANLAGFTPDVCIAVEDSPVGVRAARAAGMRVFGYLGESRSDRLSSEGAIPFRSMHELPDLIAGSV